MERLKKRDLKHGDLVVVKSAKEILNSLDGEGSLASLPFMPEMIRYCGCCFVVDKRADKVCDSINLIPGSRKMSNTVLLEDLRCDGSAHDGCQAECRLFWKETWLRRIESNAVPNPNRSTGDDFKELEELTTRHIFETKEIKGRQAKIYRCQATELCTASTLLSIWDPRPYINEVTNRNVPIGRFLRVFPRAFMEVLLLKIRRIFLYRILGKSDKWIQVAGTRTGKAIYEPLGLQPGDWVQVKTREEIIAILTPEGKDRGLSFDRDMFHYCGKIYRVRKRVDRVIDDRNGQMVELKSDCLTLDGVVCTGDRSVYKYFCPRADYPFWRENWLRRIDISTHPKGDTKRWRIFN
ncbi:hypothetical protein K0B90_07615 [bacterium]|nr:hypothetical protein [bacterium]